MSSSSISSKRWAVLALVVVAQFMVILDVAIVNVALPEIGADLGFSQQSLQWVITAYAIVFGGALLLGGRLADLLGRRRIFLAGVALFTISSLLSGLADEQSAVLAQALGAIGQMHRKGLWQEDLHLDNLLRQGNRLYLIDGAGICSETAGQPLSRQKVLENLGVFFAQLPKSLEPFTEELLVYYLLSNGEHALPMEALQKQVDKVRSWRLKDFLIKVGRECTLSPSDEPITAIALPGHRAMPCATRSIAALGDGGSWGHQKVTPGWRRATWRAPRPRGSAARPRAPRSWSRRCESYRARP